MNDTIKNNKKAWEEAFDQSSVKFKQSMKQRLKENPKSIISPYLSPQLEEAGKNGGRLAHFCCNNGRETLASLAFGFTEVKGIDIAENMVRFGNEVAHELSLNASFEANNILALTPPDKLYDVALITVGALCWFDNLEGFFKVVASWVKKDGILLIEEGHPVQNTLATKSEEGYNKDYPKNIVYDYFRKAPWVENKGMGYMTDQDYKSEPFTSYTHPMMDILNGMIASGFQLKKLEEIPVCQGNMMTELNHQGIPLSCVIVAQKQ